METAPGRVVTTVLITSLFACALVGCAGFTDEDADRAELEKVLLRTGGTVCASPGVCRRFRTVAAECMGDGEEHDGRAFYRCVLRRQAESDATHVEYVCAALSEQSAVPYVLRDCGPGSDGEAIERNGAPPPEPDEDPAHLVPQFSGDPPPPYPSAAKRERLREIARRYASNLGDSDALALVYRTTRQRAELAISSSLVNSDQPAYLIVLYGDFRLTITSADGHPFDVEGRLASVTVDAETMRPTDSGLDKRDDAEADVAGLGAPILLDP